MHILMIAPEPFFEPRGTPFSEFHRIRALTSLGHSIDLVTYPFGSDVELPGLRIIRAARPPFVRRVKVGPSWAKVPLDLSLAWTALRAAWRTRYDAVHSHEEGGVVGVPIARWLGVPHLYDMHSSLPQQVTNFDHPGGGWLARALGWSERFMIRRSRVVIVICPDLEQAVRQVSEQVPVVLIENAPGSGRAPDAGSGAAVRGTLGLDAGVPIALYTGTFEAYQGLDLLYQAFVRVRADRPDVKLVVVGGEPGQVDAARRRTDSLGLGSAVIFTGQRPADEVPAYLDAATLLVSPRSVGTNTPLKIYQYLRSGRPIVATRLRTHTQVLSDETAFLAAPTPEGLAEAMLRALADPAEAARVGARARLLAETKYTDEAYVAKTARAVGLLEKPVSDPAPEGAS
jgi:glycosyltransferase involved in cell wall biosynthesis